MNYKQKVLPAKLHQMAWILFGVGAAGIIIAFLVNRQEAFFSYLMMFMFLLSIALGAIFLIVIEYITNASWSTPFRRVVECIAGLFPYLLFLAIPLFFGMHDLFHWSHAEAVAEDSILQSKAPYLNIPFFGLRSALYFAIWILFFTRLFKNSTRQDVTRDQNLTTKNIRLSAIFIPLFALTTTFASIDWIMSLEPHWFSTIFGVYYFTGSFLAALAVITLFVVSLSERGYLLSGMNEDHYYSLGALMFAFTCFWSYIAFSQFLLIWYANLPEETFWMLQRWQGSWKGVSIALIVVRFIVPYFALLSEDAKCHPKWLKIVSVWILFAHALDLYWLIMPTYSRAGAIFGWIQLSCIVAGIGILLLAFVRRASRVNLVPIGDPKLQKGLDFQL